MSEHTPGEWRMTTPSCIWLGKRPVTLSYPGKMYEGSRAIVVQPTPYVERKANARLIAQAPAMYDYIAMRASLGDNEAKQILEVLGNAQSKEPDWPAGGYVGPSEQKAP